MFHSQLVAQTSPLYETLKETGIVTDAEARQEVMNYYTKNKPALLDVYSRSSEEWDLLHQMEMVGEERFVSMLEEKQYAILGLNPSMALNVSFYLKKLKQCPAERTVIRSTFLERWRSVIKQKEREWENALITHLCNKFVRELAQKSDTLLNRGDKGMGLAARMQWLTPKQNPELRAILRQLSRRLQQSQLCQELCSCLGRRDAEESEMRRAILDFYSLHQIKSSASCDIVGVTEGKELAHLLPTEYGMMADEKLSNLFLKRFAEGCLQMFDSTSHLAEHVRPADAEGDEVKVPRAEGPFVVCVDGSGSMTGDWENVAKALVLAIGLMAEKKHRRCVVVMFSDRIESVEFADLHEGIPLLEKFLCNTFHGGTDAVQALNYAVSVLEKETFALADFLFLSDCQTERPSEVLNQRIEQQKSRGTRFYTVVFGNEENNYYTSIANKYWRYR